MKPLNANDTNPFDLLDKFFEFGLNGADKARNILNPVFQQGEAFETVPQVRLHEDDDNYHAELDLPGVKKKEVQIEIDEDNLIINATRKDPFSNDDEKLIKYKRTLRLGKQVDSTSISATLEDGVLQIKLPKMKKAKSRTVKIN